MLSIYASIKFCRLLKGYIPVTQTFSGFTEIGRFVFVYKVLVSVKELRAIKSHLVTAVVNPCPASVIKWICQASSKSLNNGKSDEIFAKKILYIGQFRSNFWLDLHYLQKSISSG